MTVDDSVPETGRLVLDGDKLTMINEEYDEEMQFNRVSKEAFKNREKRPE